MNIYFALPCDRDASGFQFDSADDLESKINHCKNRFGQPVDEFELLMIDGDDTELFKVCDINQSNIEMWFDQVVDLGQIKKAILFYLISVNGSELREALEDIDNVIIWIDQTALECATWSFDEQFEESIPQAVRGYIDYDKYCRDLILNGKLYEFNFKGHTYTVMS